ncbi:hypothetical protein ABMA27_001428 [Loxostege sticticalis]|uniref:Uncharacterized protein n=1 Tax=Loxostege sticticalis TaxID=481309 RepID=A0ABR3HYF7_LOXSC
MVTYEIPKSDTVLKYVYKNDDKTFIKEKPKAHPLNSVQRKRRSINTETKAENITADASVKAPLIVNYETSHSPRDIEVVVPAHQRITENAIQNSALADFSIETLHEPNQPSRNDHPNRENTSSQSEEESKESSKNKNYSQSDSYESSESDFLKTRAKPNKKYTKSSESDETREKEEFRKNESGSSSVEDSREIDDDRDAPQQRNSVQKPAGSFELYEDKTYPARKSAASSTLKHSNENHGSKEEDNSKTIENSESSESSENTSRDTGRRPSPYKERKDESRETSEEDKYGSRESSHERQSNSKSDKSNAYKSQDDSRQSGENSNENNNDDDLPRPPTNERLEDNDQNAKRNNINLSTPRTIQDVDLGDFSYERVQVDDKGQIVTARDHDENDSPVPIKPLVSPDLDQNQPPKSSSLKEEDENTHRGEFGSNKPVHINDEEVKPVVEINSELNESESHEENSNEAIKINPDENQSLETILGTKASDVEEPNNKNVEHKEPEEKADVKQQFERIPLDYKHENKQEDNENNVQSDSKDESPQEGNVNQANNEGTLDTFSPKDVNYDEHLKFKFDDISIKLPEIKLPEDILAYAYEEPSYEKYEKRKDKPKSKYNQYHDEDSDDHPREQKKSRHHDDSDDDDHEYYGHSHAYGKQKQRKKGDDDEEEEDEPVDLYEKFVRERFGKRGSFQKRSEKLQDAKGLPYNPKLYQTVQKLLKQTAKIDEQAKTSGDPNAGYAWTLEYGENLK